MMVFCSIGFIIPDLVCGLDDLETQANTIVDIRVETRTEESLARKTRSENILVLLLDNGGELRFSAYQDYWHQIADPVNIGKKIKFYKNNSNSGYNPKQLEIDGKTIYKIGQNDTWAYFTLLMTAGLAVYSVNSIRKRLATQ
jgi:hypothetical protein